MQDLRRNPFGQEFSEEVLRSGRHSFGGGRVCVPMLRSGVWVFFRRNLDGDRREMWSLSRHTFCHDEAPRSTNLVPTSSRLVVPHPGRSPGFLLRGENNFYNCVDYCIERGYYLKCEV